MYQCRFRKKNCFHILEAILKCLYFITILKCLFNFKKPNFFNKFIFKIIYLVYKVIKKNLHILYTQSMRITLVTHVLPRLLAHVLAITSLQIFCHYLYMRTNFTTVVFIISITLLGHILIHCPKFPTAAVGGVVFIPRVVDLPLRSTKYHRLILIK